MKELQVRLAQSNITARKYAVKILGKAKKYREFRQNLCLFTSEAALNPKIAAAITEIPADELKIILDAEQLKPVLVKKFWYLAKRIALDMAVKFDCDMDNLQGQARLFLLWAIYGYEKDEIKFTTYIYHVIKRELQRYCLMQGSGITGNSYDLLEFKRNFIKAAKELKDKDIAPTFHNVAELLKLNLEDKSSRMKLMGAMANVGNPADFDLDGSPYARKDAWLLNVGLQQVEQDAKVQHASELCDFIENNILANETERIVFRRMKAGQSIGDIAVDLSVTKPDIQKVFTKIKQKTHAYYAQEAA